MSTFWFDNRDRGSDGRKNEIRETHENWDNLSHNRGRINGPVGWNHRNVFKDIAPFPGEFFWRTAC